MAEKRDTYQVGLSREELLVIMAYMEINELPGFDISWKDELTEEQVKMVNEVAERALFARSFIARDEDGHIFVNPLVFAAVGACAVPERSVMLRQVVPNKQLNTYIFHISREMNVIHSLAHPMMHQFLAVDERDKLVKALLSSLSLPDFTNKGDQGPVELSMKVLNEARQSIKDGTLQGLKEKFLSSSFTEEGAQTFINGLSNPVSYSILILVDQEKGIAEDLSILQGKDALWLIQPNQAETDEEIKVIVSSEKTETIIEKLSQFILG